MRRGESPTRYNVASTQFWSEYEATRVRSLVYRIRRGSGRSSHPRSSSIEINQHCLLTDREVVAPLKQRYVRKNTPSTYQEFCGAVCNLTLVSGETDSDVRVREENVEMRLFSEGRGNGKWREYLIANDISG